MELLVKDIVKATGGTLVSGGMDARCEGVSIDTRTIETGNVYIAIEGVHFDGHAFLDEAARKGAAAVVCRAGIFRRESTAIVEVKNTERALGDLASWWRSGFDIPCVAITGSNGKSTTKEMASAVVGAMGNVLKTEGNFNNTIGLPLTVFRLSASHDVAVLEMGMNAPGEIKRLSEIARPDVGLITNVTAAHLEKLHSVEAVANAKGELFETMDENTIAVINREDPWVDKVSAKFRGRKLTFGMQNDCDVRFLNMETDNLDTTKLVIQQGGKEYDVMLPVPGAHNVMNALAALAVGMALDIDPEESISRLEGFSPMSMRFERVQLANGVRIVNDSYNANPGSMKAAFRTVGSAKRAGRFIAALGDMLELGKSSDELHEKLGMDAVKMGVERLYVVGDYADSVAIGAKKSGMSELDVIVCKDVAEVEEDLEKNMKAGDVLLVKGSRGMKMERLVDSLKHKIGMG